MGAVLQIVNIAIGILIYLPFLTLYEKQQNQAEVEV